MAPWGYGTNNSTAMVDLGTTAGTGLYYVGTSTAMANKTQAEVQPIAPRPYRCRCGHEWYPRRPGERPRVCPKCKSANWDRPYKFRRPKL